MKFPTGAKLGNKQSRLDFYFSASLLPYIQKASIIPGFCSDHSGIELEVDFSKFVRGRVFGNLILVCYLKPMLT